MAGIPAPDSKDDEDVTWALETATALWKRGEKADAISWVKRAAQAARDANNSWRAMELDNAAIALAAPPTEEVADIEVDIDAAAEEPEAAPAPAPKAPPRPPKPPPPKPPPPRAASPSSPTAPAVPPSTPSAPVPVVTAAPAALAAAAPPRSASAPALKKPAPQLFTDETTVTEWPPSEFADESTMTEWPPKHNPEAQVDSIEETVTEWPPKGAADFLASLPADLLGPAGPSKSALKAPASTAAPPSAKPAPPSVAPSTENRPKTRTIAPAPLDLDDDELLSSKAALAPRRAPTIQPLSRVPAPTPAPAPAPAPAAPARPQAVALEELVIFASVPPQQRKTFLESAKKKQLNPREFVRGFALVAVLKGEALATTADSDLEVARLGPGAVLRHRGTYGQALALKLIAGEHGCEVATWSAAAVTGLLQANPAVEEGLRGGTDYVLGLLGAASKLLGPLGADGFAKLRGMLQVRPLQASAPVLPEGREAPALAVVGTGSVELLREGLPPRTLQAGELILPVDCAQGALVQTEVRAGPEGALVISVERERWQALHGELPALMALLLGA